MGGQERGGVSSCAYLCQEGVSKEGEKSKVAVFLGLMLCLLSWQIMKLLDGDCKSCRKVSHYIVMFKSWQRDP